MGECRACGIALYRLTYCSDVNECDARSSGPDDDYPTQADDEAYADRAQARYERAQGWD